MVRPTPKVYLKSNVSDIAFSFVDRYTYCETNPSDSI
jgi:hypothetical protein